MSCGCASSCHESCPETTPVTISQTFLTFDSSDAFFHEALFSRAAGTVAAASGRYVLLTLPYTPVSVTSVSLYRNSAILRRGTDYVISGRQIFLVNEAAVDEEFLAKWFSTEGATASSVTADPATGTLQPYYTAPTTGWLAMDGVTAQTKASYEALWNYLAANTDLLVPASYSGDTFTLREMNSMVYAGGAVDTLTMYIKT